MVMNDDNISPEEKLLKVIKGEPLPVPPRINPFVAQKTGPVVPPLSSVLASIVSPQGPAPGEVTPLAGLSPEFQTKHAVVQNLAAAYAPPPSAPVQSPPAVSAKPVEAPKPQPVPVMAPPAAPQARPVSSTPEPEKRPVQEVRKPAAVPVPAPAVSEKVQPAPKPVVPAPKVPAPSSVPPAVTAGSQPVPKVAPKPQESQPAVAAPKPPPPVAAAAPKAEAKPAAKVEDKSVPKVAPKPAVTPEKPKAAQAEEKPKLKVAKADVPAGQADNKPADEKAGGKPAPAVKSGGPVIPVLVPVARKREESKKSGIRNVNLGLAAAALLLIIFSVTEIFAKIRTDEVLRKPVVDVSGQNGGEAVAGYKMPALEEVIRGLDDGRWFSLPEQRDKPGADTRPGPAAMVDWMKYVQDNIKLMGFSGNPAEGTQEAIVQEGKDKDSKINYFKAGQKVQIQGAEILVENIKDDQISLTDGKRRMTIK